MVPVRDHVSDERIVEYIRTTSKYRVVTSTMVREKFGISAPTFYSRIKSIPSVKVTASPGGNKPMTLEIDDANATVQAE